jgi:hypothetical protein
MHDLNFIVVKVGSSSSSSRKLNNRPHHNIEYTHTVLAEEVVAVHT